MSSRSLPLTSALVLFVLSWGISTMFSPLKGESFPSLGKPSFQLDILKKHWEDYGLDQKGKTPEKLLPALKDMKLLSESYFNITENDIENYNWPDQSILLTWDASARFIDTFIINTQESNLETAKQNAERSVELGFYVNGGVFVVRFKGEILYGGAIDNMVSSPGYKVPTLFIQIAALSKTTPIKEQVRFVIRPLKIMAEMLKGYQGLDQQLKNRIEKPEIRDFFYKIHKLTNQNAHDRIVPWLPKLRPLVIEHVQEMKSKK